MDFIQGGLLIKSIKIAVFFLFLIICLIQQAKIEENLIRNIKLLFSTVMVFSLLLSILDIFTTVIMDSLVIPVTNLGWNLTRLLLAIFVGFFLVILGIRLVMNLRKQSVPQGTFKMGQYSGESSNINAYYPSTKRREPSRAMISSDISHSKLNITLIVISSILYLVYFVISNLSRPLQRTNNLAWIVIEIVEFPFVIFAGLTIILFNQNKVEPSVQPMILK